MTAENPTPRLKDRSWRAVRALRAVLLVILAGLILAVAASYGRRERPQTEITMRPLEDGAGDPVVDQSDQFEISGSREGRPAFLLRARTVAGFAGERKTLEHVELTLYADSGEGVTVRGSRGQFDPTARRAQLAGDVEVEASDGLHLKTGVLFYDSDRDVIFTADDIAFGAATFEGTGRGLNYLVGQKQLKIPDRVAVRVQPAVAGLPVAVTSGDLVADLDQGTVTLTDRVRIERGGDVLQSQYVKLTFDTVSHDVRRMDAHGEVVARLASGGGPPGEIQAGSLRGDFGGPAATLEEVEASGGCRFTSGEYMSRSEFARLRKSQDLLELRGEPVLFSGRDRIAAQEIDLHPAGRSLQARGEVRTVSTAGAGASPGFSGRSALSFQAAALHADHAARRATYSGGARGWQEGSSLQGESITLDEGARQLRASTGVVARFADRRSGPPAAGGGAPAVTVMSADNLIVDDARSIAMFRGHVRMTRRDAGLTADAMDAFLEEAGGRRGVARVEARGAVAARQGSHQGTARYAEYRRAEDVLVLRDDEGLAEVVDGATGRAMRGHILTFNLAEETILTETAAGGRTWIILRPDDDDRPPGEPHTPR